jgi:hypothetical protein
MLTSDGTIETYLIKPDSKIFYWKGGQYLIRENKIRSAMIRSGNKTRLDKREIVFTEGKPDPL